MVSKSAKQTCQHVYKQGNKAGLKCGRGCRGKFCCDHKKKKQTYKAQYFKKKQEVKKNEAMGEKLVFIKSITSIDKLPHIESQQRKLRALNEKAQEIIAKANGIKLAMGELTIPDLLSKRINRKVGKCICGGKYRGVEPDDDSLTMAYFLAPCKRCYYEDHSDDIYCLPNSIINVKKEYIEYRGKKSDNTIEKELAKLHDKANKIKDKIKLQKDIVTAIKEMEIKLNDLKK